MENQSQHHEFELPLEGKNPIKCISSSPSQSTPFAQTATPPSLIFTHGAGGTLHSDGILNFRIGFASQSPLICFQGSMNLSSRVKMFDAVISHHAESAPVLALGGRSMGARAAVMAGEGKEDVKALVLVSYPLHTGKGDMRDDILLAIGEGVKVLFVVGDRDEMCDLEKLEDVMGKMNAESWRIVAESADHGMTVKPKAGTQAVGELTGKVVAEWLKIVNEGKIGEQGKEGRISWDFEGVTGIWGGWEEKAANVVKPKKKPKEEPKKEPEAKPYNEPKKVSKKAKGLQPEQGQSHEDDTAELPTTGKRRSARISLAKDTQKDDIAHKRRKE